MRSTTANSTFEGGYDKIISVNYHTGLDRITITYSPTREFIRKMNRMFNNPLPPADTSNYSSEAWG